MNGQSLGRAQRAVIFDNDGVLVDSEPLHRIAWEHTFGPRQVIVSEEDYAWSIGRRDLLFAARIAEKAGLSEPPERIRDEKHAHLRHLLATDARPFAGGPELVRALGRVHLLGIATSAMRAEVEIVLDRLGLGGLFRAIVANEDVRQHKPHPEPYLICAEHLGVPADRCVVIEDSVTGVEAAKAAGMRVIAFTSTFPAGALSGADIVVEDLADTVRLVALVRSLIP